jgi:diacylglycerol kinase family enzyme
VRALVITNPRATGVSDRQRDVVMRALASEADLLEESTGPIEGLDLAETSNRGHAAALACRAMRAGVDLVVALGGDGTANEVVNGILTDGVHPGVPAFGLIPAGSTNVFAKALGLPTDPIEATGHLLDALRDGRRRTVSLGRADSRWFVFAAGIGFDGAIVRDVERVRAKGRPSTHALYARTGLRAFLREDRRHPALSVRFDDGTEVDGLYFAIATNSDPWTFVGNRPIRPTPDASFDSGVDLYARRSMGTVSAVRGFAEMLRANPRPRGRGVLLRHDLTGLTMTASRPLPFQVDGDYLGEREQVEIRSVPRALTVAG